MRHVEVLAPYPEPTIVLMGPRLRCNTRDYDVLEYFVADLKPLGRPVVFRVSGMASGPERFIERIAPSWNHLIECWGPDGDTTPGLVKRLFKNDNLERDAASLVDAHALWVWTLDSQLDEDGGLVDSEMITIAQDLGIPVFLFLTENMDYEVLEL